MGDGAENVKLGQLQVKHTVVTHGEFFNDLFGVYAFFPEFHGVSIE
ncbi:MAG: hypothetical protein AAGF85_17325 [Bacteroidota bacterium]